MENKKISVSVMALYEKFGEKLTHGRIRKTVDSDGEFYDLVVDGWKLATCDGEVNELISVENGVYTFKNDEGDFGEVTFKLTQDEFNIACLV